MSAMPVLRVVCASHDRPPVLGTFIRYEEGYREPPPDTRVYEAPHLWIRDQTAEMGGDAEVNGLRGYYEPLSSKRERAPTYWTTTNRKGEVVRHFACPKCRDTHGIRPWRFHDALEKWHAANGVADIPLAALAR